MDQKDNNGSKMTKRSQNTYGQAKGGQPDCKIYVLIFDDFPKGLVQKCEGEIYDMSGKSDL